MTKGLWSAMTPAVTRRLRLLGTLAAAALVLSGLTAGSALAMKAVQAGDDARPMYRPT
jgi:hypothetical protein